MKKTMTSKVSYFILSFLFLLITASFIFSNFDNFSLGSSKTVAQVDGTPITTREFQVALTRQVEFFSQMMGGKGLTEKQLQELGIKQSVLNGLIQQKLMINAASNMGLVVAEDELKSEIKNLPYFKTKEQFDIQLYRNLLQSNGYTPQQFEELVTGDLQQKKIENFFQNSLFSEGLAADIAKFKSASVTVSAIKVSRHALTPLISVSKDEIKAFIEDPSKQSQLKNLYDENYSKYHQAAEVKARHILIKGDDDKALEKIKALKTKLNTKNFKEIANKETEDPSGKNNGGDLGWFSQGKMVPEFEKVAFSAEKGSISEPVKTMFGYHIIYVEDKKAEVTKPLESVKEELAQMALQKTKSQDLDKLMTDVAQKYQSLLAQNNSKQIEAEKKIVDLQFFDKKSVNKFDQRIETLTLSPEESAKIFAANSGEIINLGTPGSIYLVKVGEKTTGPENSTDKIKTELTTQQAQYQRKAKEEFSKNLNNKAKIVTNAGLL